MSKHGRCKQHSKLSVFKWYYCWALALTGMMHWALHRSCGVGAVLHLRGEVGRTGRERILSGRLPHHTTPAHNKAGNSVWCWTPWRQSGHSLPLKTGMLFDLKKWTIGNATKQSWYILLRKTMTWSILCYGVFMQKYSSSINFGDTSGNARRCEIRFQDEGKEIGARWWTPELRPQRQFPSPGVLLSEGLWLSAKISISELKLVLELSW